MARPIVTRIASKFLVAVPPEFRDVFELREGDLFEWKLDEPTSEIRLIPKRAQLITPRIRQRVEQLRQPKPSEVEVPAASETILVR